MCRCAGGGGMMVCWQFHTGMTAGRRWILGDVRAEGLSTAFPRTSYVRVSEMQEAPGTSIRVGKVGLRTKIQRQLLMWVQNNLKSWLLAVGQGPRPLHVGMADESPDYWIQERELYLPWRRGTQCHPKLSLVFLLDLQVPDPPQVPDWESLGVRPGNLCFHKHPGDSCS